MPPFASGQFQTGGGWGEQSSNWFRKNASSVVLPVIALAVLGGGVYFYTRGQGRQERPIVEFQETASPAAGGKEMTATPMTSSPQAKPTSRIMLSPEGAPILGGPEILMEKGRLAVAAKKGEGLTHLARRAGREYLAKTNPGFTVTKEHKIFIEDFLKDAALNEREGNDRVQVGEEVRFSEELIRQAIAQARTLSDKQLKNLEQFSARVSNL